MADQQPPPKRKIDETDLAGSSRGSTNYFDPVDEFEGRNKRFKGGKDPNYHLKMESLGSHQRDAETVKYAITKHGDLVLAPKTGKFKILENIWITTPGYMKVFGVFKHKLGLKNLIEIFKSILSDGPELFSVTIQRLNQSPGTPDMPFLNESNSFIPFNDKTTFKNYGRARKLKMHEMPCGNCGKLGHFVKDCVWPIDPVYMDIAACIVCNSDSHLFDDCPFNEIFGPEGLNDDWKWRIVGAPRSGKPMIRTEFDVHQYYMTHILPDAQKEHPLYPPWSREAVRHVLHRDQAKKFEEYDYAKGPLHQQDGIYTVQRMIDGEMPLSTYNSWREFIKPKKPETAPNNGEPEVGGRGRGPLTLPREQQPPIREPVPQQPQNEQAASTTTRDLESEVIKLREDFAAKEALCNEKVEVIKKMEDIIKQANLDLADANTKVKSQGDQITLLTAERDEAVATCQSALEVLTRAKAA